MSSARFSAGIARIRPGRAQLLFLFQPGDQRLRTDDLVAQTHLHVGVRRKEQIDPRAELDEAALGVLLGPLCPIYGTGAVLMAYFLPLWTTQVESTFLLALVLCGTLEYITSWLMEKLFHARWWDYSQKRFNINGRVCASNLLAFGVMGVFVVKVLKPFAFGLFAKIPPVWLDAITITLTVLLVADVAISAGVLTKIRGAAESVRADNTEAITKAVREALMAQGFLLRHPLHAFPEVQFYNKAHLARLKAKHDELQANMREKREKLQQELDRLEEKRKALKKGKK